MWRDIGQDKERCWSWTCILKEWHARERESRTLMGDRGSEVLYRRGTNNETAAQSFLQGATQAVNTHFLRANVCRSTHVGTSHFGVLTNQLSWATIKKNGHCVLMLQLALLELFLLLLSTHLMFKIRFQFIAASTVQSFSSRYDSTFLHQSRKGGGKKRIHYVVSIASQSAGQK